MTQTTLESLIHTHQVGVWRYLRFLGCEANLAQDLTQEVFLEVIKKPFENRSEEQSASYLRTAARFRYGKYLRSTSKEKAPLDFDVADEVWNEQVTDDSMSAYLSALKDCMEELPTRAQSALKSKYWNSGKLEDVAESLGMELSGLKSLLQRSKAKLRACINGRNTR